MFPHCSKFQNQNVQTLGYVFHDTNGQNHEQHWRCRGTSCTKLAWAPIGWIAMGETIRRSFVRTWMGEISELGMCVRSSKTRVISVSTCVWYQNGWKGTEYGFYVEVVVEKFGYWWTYIISWPYVLGMHSACVQTEWKNHWTENKDVCVNISAGATKHYMEWQQPHAQTMASSIRHGGTCSKMRRAILWVGERESRATLQNFASSLWWSSIQTGGTWISWRIARSMLANCLEMLAFGKNWTTWYSMVSQQACKISHKMDWGMWQTLSWADFLHSSHEWLSSILSCGKHGTALQTRLVSRFRLC